MKRILGVVAVVLGISLLGWVGVAMATDHMLVADKLPLKPVLWGFIILSAGIGWVGDDEELPETDAQPKA